MRNYGCRIKWDMVHALELWNQGVRARDIAAVVGTTERAVHGAAIRHNWPMRTKPKAKFDRCKVLRRCGCGAKYKAHLDDPPHCTSDRFASIYGVTR
jgi:hypothetical protein